MAKFGKYVYISTALVVYINRNIGRQVRILFRILFILAFFIFAGTAFAASNDTAQQVEEESGRFTLSNDIASNNVGNDDTSGSDIGTGGRTDGYAMDEYGAMELNGRSAKMLLLEGQEASRAGDPVTAMRKIKRSLKLDDDDMDAHLLYATLLDEQVHSQTEKDPSLYNKCVEEWLAIMRNRYGEEKGMRFHGINPCGDLFHDEERSITAKTALVKLTGYSPKTFETDAHYLKRVLLPTTEKVSGSVVSSKAKAQTQ